MYTNNGRVDEQLFQVCIALQGLGNPVPDAISLPSGKAPESSRTRIALRHTSSRLLYIAAPIYNAKKHATLISAPHSKQFTKRRSSLNAKTRVPF